METQRVMQIMDASFRTHRTIERSLHEIDRRALNAMVLVKRHGTKLASYGVVAQAFREQAVHLRDAASPLQQAITPLVQVHMRRLQHGRYRDSIRRALGTMNPENGYRAHVTHAGEKWQHDADAEQSEELGILRRLVETVVRLQEGIAEQEYVVTNGRIEAALSEQIGAPLMRVSREMGWAVAKVKDAIWKYRAELEDILHESSTGI